MNKRFLVGNIEAGGFGAMYARRKLIMQVAQAFNRIPVFKYTTYHYEDPFISLDYTLEDLKKEGITSAKPFMFTDTDDQVAFFDFWSYWNNDSLRNTYQTWRPSGLSYLLYSGEMYDKLKLNDLYKSEVQGKIEELKNEWGVSSLDDIVGIHFRRGDKITEGSSVFKYPSDEFFIDFARRKYPECNTFFVTSDDATYLEYLEGGYPDIKFLWDKGEPRYGDATVSNAHLVARDQSLKHQETFTFIKNVEILKMCKCVIGGYNVQMTKISGSINSYLKNKESLYLINPVNNELDVMGSSDFTS